MEIYNIHEKFSQEYQIVFFFQLSKTAESHHVPKSKMRLTSQNSIKKIEFS